MRPKHDEMSYGDFMISKQNFRASAKINTLSIAWNRIHGPTDVEGLDVLAGWSEWCSLGLGDGGDSSRMVGWSHKKKGSSRLDPTEIGDIWLFCMHNKKRALFVSYIVRGLH